MKLQTNDFISDVERWRDAYLGWMNTQDYSSNTLELYSRIINQFIEYSLGYQDEMTLKDIRSSYFNDFVNYLEEEARLKGRKQNRDGKYLSRSTKDTYMKAIKGFFTYITDNNDELYTFDRYFRNIKQRDHSKQEEKMKHLTEDEIEKLLNILEKIKSKKRDYNSYRNSLLIKLMLFGGLRISEALFVRLDDFRVGQDEDMYLISIYGKGGKEQTAYIAKESIEGELEYFRDTAALSEGDIIMCTKNNTQLDRVSASTIVNRIYIKAGIRKRGLHILRHTLAMRLTQRDVNPIVIKKILRHSNIATTTIYSKATQSAVASVMKIDFKEQTNETQPIM